MAYFHPKEELQVWALEGHLVEHGGPRLLVEFADGETYIAQLDTAYDSDNSGELDLDDESDPRFDEFHQVVLEVLDTAKGGSRPYEGKCLSLGYRDFPAKITDPQHRYLCLPGNDAEHGPTARAFGNANRSAAVRFSYDANSAARRSVFNGVFSPNIASTARSRTARA